MSLMKGEGKILMNKYQKSLGITKFEANKKVGEFIEKLNEIKKKLNDKNKSELEISNKLDEEFQREFSKLE